MSRTVTVNFSDAEWYRLKQKVLEAVDGELYHIIDCSDGDIRIKNVTNEGTYAMEFDVRCVGEDGLGQRCTHHLTLDDLIHAYWSLPDRTHCTNSDILDDPDACSVVILIQQAIYGEVIFG